MCLCIGTLQSNTLLRGRLVEKFMWIIYFRDVEYYNFSYYTVINVFKFSIKSYETMRIGLFILSSFPYNMHKLNLDCSFFQIFCS